MSGLYYVVDAVTGVRFEPGHVEEHDAFADMVTRYADLPNVDSPGRFVIEHQEQTPWAYAAPMQQANR